MQRKSTTKPKSRQKFNRWTLIEYQYSKNSKPYWLVRCACGTEAIRSLTAIINGYSKSCGCYRLEVSKKTFLKHGSCRTPEYRIFRSMHDRCERPNSKCYSDYGGRGIYVCKRWQSFESFISDMGPRPAKNYTIERLDNDGLYSPDNCKWATRKEQARNKRNNHWITFNGETLILADWAKRTGKSTPVILNRLQHGWSVDKALTEPLRKDRRRGAVTQ